MLSNPMSASSDTLLLLTTQLFPTQLFPTEVRMGEGVLMLHKQFNSMNARARKQRCGHHTYVGNIDGLADSASRRWRALFDTTG